mmetsp:Transcript_39044/g.110318  ORF Transcript_39044/g.110318 Transcript_39044/m.110318 type:complete len:206 (-) Transcript_39044:218-835(-)
MRSGARPGALRLPLWSASTPSREPGRRAYPCRHPGVAVRRWPWVSASTSWAAAPLMETTWTPLSVLICGARFGRTCLPCTQGETSWRRPSQMATSSLLAAATCSGQSDTSRTPSSASTPCGAPGRTCAAWGRSAARRPRPSCGGTSTAWAAATRTAPPWTPWSATASASAARGGRPRRRCAGRAATSPRPRSAVRSSSRAATTTA